MAEIESGGGKKLSTRVDLTPMVDLGFLLITFFMFTTTMSKPKSLEIVMPSDKKTDVVNKVKDYTALTLLLSKENRIYYYYGIGDNPLVPPKVEVTYFKNQGGVRDAIIKLVKDVNETKQRDAGQPGISETDVPTILIKPDTNSTYLDMVNALDEMQINGIGTYAIVDISDVERGFIKATEAANSDQ